MRAIVAVSLGLSLFTASPVANAHDFRPAVLSLKETAPGTYSVRWSPPRIRRDQPVVAPVFPDTVYLQARKAPLVKYEKEDVLNKYTYVNRLNGLLAVLK